MLEPTGFLAHLDQAVEVWREIVALLPDGLRQRRALANAICDRPHVPTVSAAGIAGLPLEDPKRVMADVEGHAHAFAQQAQVAIADPVDHERDRPLEKARHYCSTAECRT